MNQALAQVGPQGMAANPFAFDAYSIKRPWLTFLGRTFQIFDPSGNQIMFVRHKILTFKDEWNIFTDSTEKVPLVRVKARSAIGLNIVTDVFDANSGQVAGTVRNKGLKSIISDSWEVLDQAGNVVGELKEDSNGLLRRFMPTFFGMPIIPGKWSLSFGGQHVAEIDEQRVFFGKSFTVKVLAPQVDRRFAVACALLALMKEITRESS
jgi:uncharacterized protein YxjI